MGCQTEEASASARVEEIMRHTARIRLWWSGMFDGKTLYLGVVRPGTVEHPLYPP